MFRYELSSYYTQQPIYLIIYQSIERRIKEWTFDKTYAYHVNQGADDIYHEH